MLAIVIISLVRDFHRLRSRADVEQWTESWKVGKVFVPPLTAVQFIKLVASFVLLLCVPIVVVPFVANLIMIIGFTFVGLIAFYRTAFLSTVAIGKIVLFDILKITRVNESVSRQIYEVKRAVDEAALQLEQEIMSESAVRLSYAFKPEESNPAELHAQYGAVFGLGRHKPQCRSIISKIDSSMTRAFLLLSLFSQSSRVPDSLRQQQIESKKRTPYHTVRTELALLFQKSLGLGVFTNEACVPDEDSRFYSSIRQQLAKGILSRFYSYMAFVTAGVIIWVGSIFMLEILLYHISELTSTQSWLNLLIPGLILFQSAAQTLKKRRSRFRDNENELILEAKGLLLLFATHLKEDDLADGSVKLFHSDDSQSDELSSLPPRRATRFSSIEKEGTESAPVSPLRRTFVNSNAARRPSNLTQAQTPMHSPATCRIDMHEDDDAIASHSEREPLTP